MLSDEELDQLETMLILKHGSIKMMYDRYLVGDIKLTEGEKCVIIRHLDISHDMLADTKLKFDRAMHGVYQ